MEKIFVLVTELQNQTNQQLEFEVVNGSFHIRALRRAKIRQIKLWKILQCCRKHDSAKWKIRLLIHNQYSGIEISPLHLLTYARIVFKFEGIGNDLYLLCIEGILEKRIDQWLRLKYLGCMRGEFWKRRPYIQIARADPKWAIKLRDEVEEPPQQLVVVPLARDEKSLQQKQSQKEEKKAYLIEGKKKVNGSPVPVDNSVEISKSAAGTIPAVQSIRRKTALQMENKTDDGVRNIIPPVELETETFRGGIDNGVHRENGLLNRTGEVDMQQMIQNMDTTIRLLLLVLSFMLVCFVHLLFSI